MADTSFKQCFGPILGILLNVLRNLKYFLDILHKYLYITGVVAKLRNVLVSSALDIFRCFWSIFYCVPQIIGKHLTLSSEFFYLFLWTPVLRMVLENHR